MSETQRTVPGGLVVFFEGIDGVGKTTQLKLAADELRSDGWAVQTTRAHGGTPFGDELRAVSFLPIERAPETNLYLSVTIHNELSGQVRQWRQQGAITLIDRGMLTMAAYQIYGDGCDPELGYREARTDTKRFEPELTILYTAALDVAFARIKERGSKTDYFESQPRDYFERVETGFEEASTRYEYDIVRINAERPVEAMQVDTLSAIATALEKKQSVKP